MGKGSLKNRVLKSKSKYVDIFIEICYSLDD